MEHAVGVVPDASLLGRLESLLPRAGTDLYFPPFGPLVLRYVAAEGEKPSVEAVKSGKVNGARAKQIREFKAPVGKIHFYGGVFILFLASIHASGALVTEWSAPNDKSARGRARLMLFGPRKAQ